jgi:hypothetical protein
MSKMEYRVLFLSVTIVSCHLPRISKFIVDLSFYAAYEFGKDSFHFILQSSVFSGINSASCLEFAWIVNIKFWHKEAFHVDST